MRTLLLLVALVAGQADLGAQIEAEMRRDRSTEHRKAPLLGCLTSEEAVDELPGDPVRYRPLDREDFRADEEFEGLCEIAASDPAARGGICLAVELRCVSDLRVREVRAGHFEAVLSGLDYFAIFYRERSRWDPRPDLDSEATLAHQRLHFAIAERKARSLAAEREATERSMRTLGRDGRQASDRLRRRWTEHWIEIERNLAAEQARYDRETRSGNDVDAQRKWAARVEADLSALRMAPREVPEPL